MIFIEFPTKLHPTTNIIRYRDIDSNDWHYMSLDIELLHLLVYNFGVISTYRLPDTYQLGTYSTCDNPTTSNVIKVTYGGANIELYCGNKTKFYLPHLDQNY
jgi:hypothetical protein